MLHFARETPEREEWWAISDQTGEVFGPFDPGTVWFETLLHVRGGDLLQLQRVADLILNEAHAGWERLQRALAFMQPNGATVYRRFMESGVLPSQTPALGLAGGLDIPGYLGDGGATGAGGLHFNDTHNGTTISGFAGGVGGSGTTLIGRTGRGPGRGHPASHGNGACGGGGLGTAGQDGTSSSLNGVLNGAGGITHHADIFRAMREDIWSQTTLNFGGGGGSMGFNNHRGGQAGDGYVNVVNGTLTTVARNLQGRGGQPSPTTRASGGGSGGALFLLGHSIAYGSGAMNVSGGASSRPRSGGAGGNGRVYQVYFDSKADNLQVTNGVQSQFRILRSVPIGQNTFL